MSDVIQKRYVDPNVLNSTFWGLKHHRLSDFVDSTTDALESIRDRVLIYMYQCGNWRWSIVAIWLCGIGGFSQHRDRITMSRCDRGDGYAVQWHCFELVRLGMQEAIAPLTQYLNQRQSDVHPANAYWHSRCYFYAFGALQWLDHEYKTSHVALYRKDLEYRRSGEQFSSYAPNFEEASAQLQRVIDFVARHFPSY